MRGTGIERLTIDAGTMGPADARRLALLVAAGLADAQVSPASLPRLAVSVAGGADGLDQLAARIVAAALGQIGRAP